MELRLRETREQCEQAASRLAEVIAAERVDRLCRDREGGEFWVDAKVRRCPLRRASRAAQRPFVATRNTEVF